MQGTMISIATLWDILTIFRYIDWFLTTPLLLLDLLLTAGLPWPTILAAMVADEIMIVSGLIGALVPTRYKWGFWTFGMLAFFYVVYVVVIEGRRQANHLGGSIKKTYNMCGILTIGLWFLYPIAWGVSEGGNLIHPDSEAIFYGILDVLAKPGFTLLLLYGHSTINPADLGLHSRYSPVPGDRALKQGNAPASQYTSGGLHNGAQNEVQPGTTGQGTVTA